MTGLKRSECWPQPSQLTAPEIRSRFARGGFVWTDEVNQRIGSWIALWALKNDVRPATLTIANMVLGTTASVLAVLTFARWPVVTSLLACAAWQVAYSIDCADGQLARATGATSQTGAVLDLVCDYVVQASVVAAVAACAHPSLTVWHVPALWVLASAGWLLGPFYSGVSGPLPRRPGGDRHALVNIVRHSRDYGIHLTAVAVALAVAPAAAFAVVLVVAALNMAFICRFVWQAR